MFGPKILRIWFLQQLVFIVVAILVLAVHFQCFFPKAHSDLAFNNRIACW